MKCYENSQVLITVFHDAESIGLRAKSPHIYKMKNLKKAAKLLNLALVESSLNKLDLAIIIPEKFPKIPANTKNCFYQLARILEKQVGSLNICKQVLNESGKEVFFDILSI
ncbi:MAG TPA: hypothetical protein PLQ36_00835 [Candidatus Gracilibacteria bacterium]|nr:hypothetical protein [Candidatus Gracilibacteria bacterium]